MKRTFYAILFLLLSSFPILANQRVQGWCEKGSVKIVTSGLTSTNAAQGSYPSCTVTVFNSGLGTTATIYADNNNTPISNPFTADTTGHWFFYVADGYVDIQLSGPGFVPPYTFGSISVVDAFIRPTGTGGTPILKSNAITQLGCNVNLYGADITGATDSLAGFNNAKTACPGGIFVPDGNYNFTSPFQINQNNFTMRCNSSSAVLKYIGTTPVDSVVLVGPDSPFNVRVEGCTIKGDPAGNVVHAINLTKANHTTVKLLTLKDAQTCLGHYGGVDNTIEDVSCSVNNGGFLFRPTIGFDFDGRPENRLIAGTTVTIIRPTLEGIFGPGLKFKNSSAITVIGGTSEANVIGVQMVDITAANISLQGIGLEVNCLIFSGGNYILNDAGACYGKYNVDGTPHDYGVLDAGYQTQFIGGSYTDGQYHVTAANGSHARGTTIMNAKLDTILIDPICEDVTIFHSLFEITGTIMPGIVSNGDPIFPFGVNPTIFANFKSNGGAIVAGEQYIAGNLFLNSPLAIIPDASDQTYLTLLGRDRITHGIRLHMAEGGNINYLEVLDTTNNATWNQFISSSKSFSGMDTNLYATTIAGPPTKRVNIIAGGTIEISDPAGNMPTPDSTLSIQAKGMIGTDFLKITPTFFANCNAVVDKVCRINDYNGLPAAVAWGQVVTAGTGISGTLATLIYTVGIGWTVYSR